jgi:hypothetical protein
MRCFYHADREAVGVCKSCQRGICHECIADVGKGIACKNRCEDDARGLVALADAAIRQQPANEFIVARMRRNRLVTAIFYLLLGGGFVVTGILYPYVRFGAYLGAVFVVFGIYTLTQLPNRPNKSLEPTAGRRDAQI